MRKKKVIVVPDGITLYNGCLSPTFVYRAVLDEVLKSFSDCHIIIAPANAFGYKMKEQFVGYDYLIKKNSNIFVEVFDVNTDGYIDTWGNARYLRAFLNLTCSVDELDDVSYVLVVAHLHAKRALMCFERNGFVIDECRSVGYNIANDEKMPRRLFYYKFQFLHALYEELAFIFDSLKKKV